MEQPQGSGRRPFPLAFSVLMLTLAAFLLRAYRIDWQSLWVDENFTMLLSTQDLAAIARITSGDVHPPLYYFLLHYWTLPAGLSEYSLRFPSLFFSVLTVPLAWKTASLLVGRRAALLTTLLIAIAPFQVYYAQEARMYSLLALLSLASTYAMARVTGFRATELGQARQTRRKWFPWSVLVLSSAALLYAHYFGFLVLLFQNTVVFLTRITKKGFLIRWCLSQVAVAALFAPWIPVMTRVYVANDEDWRRFVPFGPMFEEIMVSLSLGRSVDEAFSLPLAGGFFLALLAGMAALALRKAGRPVLLLLGLYLFEPILLTYVVSFTKPVYGGSRYLIFVAPAFYLLVSQGLSALRERWRPLSIALLAYLVLGSGYSLANHYWNATYAKDDYRSLARVMEEKAVPEDGLVVMNGLVFDYYYRGESPRVALPQQYPVNQGEVTDELNRFSQGKSRLWFLRWKFNGLDPDDFILNQLEDHGEKLEEGTVGGLYYTLYRLSSDAPFRAAAQYPVADTFDNKVLLEAYSLSVERVAAGNSIVVTLSMKALQKLDQDYKVSLSLTDAQGYRWMQEDKPPTGYSMSRWRVGEPVQTRFRLNVPVGMPPGDYSLAAVVYAPDTLQPVAVFDSNQKPLGATLPMGRVRVDRGKLYTNTAAVTPSHPEAQDVAPGLRLLGYDLPPGEVDQGGTLTLMLYWQALSQPQDDYQVSIRLTGGAGNMVQDFSEKPHHGLYPTTEWREGEIVRDVHLVPIPSDASPGTTRVTVALTSPGVPDPQGVELATVLIRERLRTFEIPAVENPREVDLGGKVRFLGYALSGGPAFRPGGKIDLNLYWQAKANNIGNYAIFTHLLDVQNRIWAQHDGLPVDGAEPTPGWIAGQSVVDKHQLAIKADAPPGEYVLEVGMYDPTTGQRLKTPAGEDRILLGSIRLQ